MLPITSFDVFFDESGQTGMDLLNRAQPFYVLAGWIVPRTRRNDLSKVIRERIKLAPDRRELKGSRLLKYEAGRKEAASLINEMIDAGCIPTFMLFEKKYAIAAKIVDTFIDPPVNDLVGTKITWDRARKQQLADQIYAFSDATLRLVWQAIRDPTVHELTRALAALVAEGQTSKHPMLATILSGALTHVHEIHDQLESTYLDPVWRHAQALSMPSVYGLLSIIDEFGQAVGQADISIFHDETSVFGPIIEHVVNQMRSVPPEDLRMLDGNTIRVGLASIQQISLTDSKSEPLIQAADVVASAIIAWAQRRSHFNPNDDILTTLVDGLIAPLGLLPDPSPGVLVVSAGFIREMIGRKVSK